MRFVILFLLLIILGFIAWKAVERFQLLGPPAKVESDIEPTGSNEEETAPTVPAGPIPPSFDLVRVGRDGYAVIAGRGEPASTMTILANEEDLASEVVGSDSSWAVSTDTPLDAGTVELALSMTTTDGQIIRSEETIVIYVPENGERPLVVRTTPGGATQVLQTPQDADSSYGPLTLESIDYDDSESVIFTGRAEPERRVEVLANRQLVGAVTSDLAGRWTLTAAMTPGIYTLLIVQYDETGRRPAYVIELPFERATSDQIELRDGRVVVQPGNSLWRIARRAYGTGAQYTIIYEANVDQIRDPDLIYPGQIFEVPEDGDNSQRTGTERIPETQEP